MLLWLWCWGEWGECLPSIAVILSLCPMMAIRSLKQITLVLHQTPQLLHFTLYYCLRRMCKVSLVSVRPCHIKLVSVVLFTSYFRLEQGQAHLSSSLRPINSINIESAASTLFRLGRDSVTQWLAAGLTRHAGSVCFPWVIPTGYDFIRQPQKHSRDLVTFWP